MRRRTFVLLLSLLSVVATLLPMSPAAANHRKGTYRKHGYFWFARYYDLAYYSMLYVSDNCNSNEVTAGNNMRASSRAPGATEFLDRWPSGFGLNQMSCDGKTYLGTDIKLQYQPREEWESQHGSVTGDGKFGGHNISTTGRTAYCRTRNVPDPQNGCGYQISFVHINKWKWDQQSSAYRARLILHETGHSLGLAHHCSVEAVMNDGRSKCNPASWTGTTGYKPTDRSGIRNIYPGWQYP